MKNKLLLTVLACLCAGFVLWANNTPSEIQASQALMNVIQVSPGYPGGDGYAPGTTITATAEFPVASRLTMELWYWDEAGNQYVSAVGYIEKGAVSGSFVVPYGFPAYQLGAFYIAEGDRTPGDDISNYYINCTSIVLDRLRPG